MNLLKPSRVRSSDRAIISQAGLPKILCALLLLTAAWPAHAQAEFPGVAPYMPKLTEGEGQAICHRFAAAWHNVFRSQHPLAEEYLDMEEAFPDAMIQSYPPERKANGRYGGLYERAFSAPVDFDRDGEKEVLHIEGASLGWRYLGAKIFLFASEADYAAAQSRYEKELSYRGELNIWRLREPLDPAPEELVSLRPADVIHVISMHGLLYVMDSPAAGRGRSVSGPRDASLYLLNGPSGPDRLCTIELLPPYATLDDAVAKSPFYQSLSPIYGGGGACMGTLGWTAWPFREPLRTILHRPWAMFEGEGTVSEATSSPQDAARELRYLSWGLSDPSSWEAYLQWKSTQDQFRSALARYYLDHFVSGDAEEKEWAEQAYRHVSDRIIYNFYYDNFHLTALADQPGESIGVSYRSSPQEIVAATITVAPERIDPAIRYELIRAAMYTSQPLDVVRRLIDQMAAAYQERTSRARSQAELDHLETERSRAANSIMLAGLGDMEYVSLALALGADVNAPTNEFRKTALMYAAQIDALPAVKFLLAHGADPNASTSSADNYCVNLERDHRTALMYAAENASLEVIDALFVAEADLDASDTKGNGILWYLERNDKLSESEKAEARELLTPR